MFRNVVSIVANDPDRDWEAWGKQNPYYGVISDPQFLNENLDDEKLKEFFVSGRNHVDHVCQVIRDRIRPDFAPGRALDFGCGVGRLVVSLAQRIEFVTGVDISPSMLSEARENCVKFDVPSAELLHVDQMTALRPGSFDFIHSFIVFQHIPTDRGELILRNLLSLLAEGGVGALHFTYADVRRGRNAFASRLSSVIRKRVSFIHASLNLLGGHPSRRPLMQMNSYSLSRIFEILIGFQCQNFYMEFSDHSGFRGAMIYFEKAPKLVRAGAK